MRFRHSDIPGGTDLSSTMEKQIEDLNGKIKTLSFRVQKSVEVVKKQDRVAPEMHKKSLETMITAVKTLKVSIEEKKFAKGEEQEAVKEWAADIVVDEADDCIRELTAHMEQIDRESQQATLLYEHQQAIEMEKKEIRKQQEATERAHTEQLEFQRIKLELQQARTKPAASTSVGGGVVKMPKLVITKFDGTPQD